MEDYKEQRDRLVSYLKASGIVRSDKVERAFLTVPREEFVSGEMKAHAYVDTPLPLMHTGQTISAPSMLAYMVEALELEAHHKVLEIGAGSGYAAAIMAEAIRGSGDSTSCYKVLAIEIDQDLVSYARDNLQRCGYSDHVDVILGDGSLGLTDEAPFDRIMVSAAASEIPRPLLDQLAKNGRMVIPVGSAAWSQELYLVSKDESGKIKEDYMMDVVFVPLKMDSGLSRDEP